MAYSFVVESVVVPIVSTLGAGYLTFRIAKWQILRTLRDAEYQRGCDAVRDALDQYLEWLVSFRYFVDPFDRRHLGGSLDTAKLGAVPQFLDVIDRLEAGKDAGQRFVDALDDARYQLRIDEEFLIAMHSLVDSVLGHWRTLMQTRPEERQRGLDTMNWILARDSLKTGELEANEVFSAEKIVSHLRYHLHRQYNWRVHGEKAVGEPVQLGPLTLGDGRFVYGGPIPFQSPAYFARRDRTVAEIIGADDEP